MRKLWLLVAGLALFVPELALAQSSTPEKQKDVGKSFAVPFRLSDSGHIVVRAKINGKGPFNFIVDTGAPLVYVAVPVAKKLDIKGDKKAATELDEFQIEGGPVHKKLKCIVETPFQLDGMNAMGMAGVELHGIIGYSLLAHFRMEIDLTQDRMNWTLLDFTPPAPLSAGAKGNELEQLDALGKFAKIVGALLGNKGAASPTLRGFIGMQMAEKDNGVFVQGVLAQSPALAAGVKSGDRLVSVEGKAVATTKEVMDAFANVKSGQQVRVVVQRGEASQEITITAGEGM